MSTQASLCIALTLLFISVAYGVEIKRCIARKSLDSLYDEEFSFEVNTWAHVENIGVAPAEMGDSTIQPLSGVFGFYHGSLVNFNALNKTIRMSPVLKPSPTPVPTPTLAPGIVPAADENKIVDVVPSPENPHIHDSVKEFIMYYDGGDIGAPCSVATPRAAEVHIWCAYQAKNCDGIPGAADNATPFSGNLTSGFALCGILYNQTIGVCRGLQLHLLSNKCPSGTIVKRVIGGQAPIPGHAPSNSATVALVVCSVILLILIVLFFSCWGYRASVLGRKGIEAMPGYDLVGENRNRFSKIEGDNKVGISVAPHLDDKSSYGTI